MDGRWRGGWALWLKWSTIGNLVVRVKNYREKKLRAVGTNLRIKGSREKSSKCRKELGSWK